MAKKTWREWKMTVGAGYLTREKTGTVEFAVPNWQIVYRLTPSEARRLFQKLSGDYRD